MTDGRITNAGVRPTPPPRPAGPANAAANQRPAMANDAGNVSNVTRLLAGLKGSEGLEDVTPERWQAIAKQVYALPPAQAENVKAALLKQGLMLWFNRDAGEVSLFGQQGAVTAEPATGKLRVTLGGDSVIYQGTQPVETIMVTPERTFKVTRKGQPPQLWDPATGRGKLADGSPIPPRFADPVKGEPPRKPWAKPPENTFKPPEGSDALDADFQKLYNDAVKASGGEVVEALHLTRDDEPSRYNCHSFATTGAHGDLADPFDRVFSPRWVNFPGFQLANGPFKLLKPEQRVHVGDVVVYHKDGQITHTGKVVAVDADGNPSRIQSKWGAYGLYVHDPMAVPAIYGDIVGFYRPE